VVAINNGSVVVEGSFGALSVTVTNASKNIAGFVGKNDGGISAGSVKLVLMVEADEGSEKVESISGFATMNKGYVSGTSENRIGVTITVNKDIEVTTLAGLIGKMDGGGISYATVGYSIINCNLKTETFGGVVAYLTNGVVGYESDTDESIIEISGPISAEAGIFGGVVAVANGQGSIIGAYISAGDTAGAFEITALDKQVNGGPAYGLVIGLYEAKLNTLRSNG
jgi:hypothetical protein